MKGDTACKGVGGLNLGEPRCCYRALCHVHKKSPWPGPLNSKYEIKCNQVARLRARRRARVGGLITARALGSNDPRPHAEILAKRIRQIFFLSTGLRQVGGGGRGFKSPRPSAPLPHWAACTDFFPQRHVLIQSNEIKEIKKQMNVVGYEAARRGIRQNLRIYFLPAR